MTSIAAPSDVSKPARASQLRAPIERFRDLGQVWLVGGPKLLAPWIPQLADALADGTWMAPWRILAGSAPVLGLLLGFAAPFLWPDLSRSYAGSLLFLATVIACAILTGTAGFSSSELVCASPFDTRNSAECTWLINAGMSADATVLLLT